jgi:hypothetical protein
MHEAIPRQGGEGLARTNHGRAGCPPPTAFTDVDNILFDSTTRYDANFFRLLTGSCSVSPSSSEIAR